MEPAGSDHRLDEDGGDARIADPRDLRLERLDRVVRHVTRLGIERAHPVLIGRDPADRGAEAVGAVVALRAPDQVDALRLVDGREVAPRELGGGVDRVAPAEPEEDARIVDDVLRVGGEALGERDRRLAGERAERRVARELTHLAGDRLDDLLAPVPDVHAPEARGRVEVAVPVRVPDARPLPPLDHDLGSAHRGHVRERVPEARVRAHRPTVATAAGAGNRRRGTARPRVLRRCGAEVLRQRCLATTRPRASTTRTSAAQRSLERPRQRQVPAPARARPACVCAHPA